MIDPKDVTPLIPTLIRKFSSSVDVPEMNVCRIAKATFDAASPLARRLESPTKVDEGHTSNSIL